MQLSHYLELLRYYYRLTILLFVTIVGGVVGFSVLFLFISPVYTGTAIVSLLPTQTELAYSQNTVRSTSINPANLLTQTHIEYLTSREVSRLAVDRLSAEAQASAAEAPGNENAPVIETVPGLKDRLTEGFRNFRREFRRIYNTLNSGRHIPLDPYTDTVLSLQDSIEIEMIEGTYILEIAVKWPTPEGAAAAANVLAEVYLDRAREDALEASLDLERELRAELARGESNFSSLEQLINNLRLTRAANLNFLRVIDTAAVPLYPSFPKVVINAVFAVVGWIFVTAFALVAIDTFSNTIKTRSDASRIFGGRFLGFLKLQKPKRWNRASAATTLRLLSDGRFDKGGTLSLGTASESAKIHRFVKEALLTGRQKSSIEPNPSSRATASAALPFIRNRYLAEVANNVPKRAYKARNYTLAVNEDLERPENQSGAVVEAAGPDALRDFGGVADVFSFSHIENTEWMVLGIWPGKITETELKNLMDELHYRGVRHVFGVFLQG